MGHTLTRTQIVAAGPCDPKIIDALWADSPRVKDETTLEFPDPWTEEETIRLLRRDARAVFWLVARGLLPITFGQLCMAYYVVRDERRAEAKAAKREAVTALENGPATPRERAHELAGEGKRAKKGKSDG